MKDLFQDILFQVHFNTQNLLPRSWRSVKIKTLEAAVARDPKASFSNLQSRSFQKSDVSCTHK